MLKWAEFIFLSTPSLGITSDGNWSYVEIEWIPFQLPLSGSLKIFVGDIIIDVEKLSTPSLGITLDLPVHFPLTFLRRTFNSLSRDHLAAPASFWSCLSWLSTPSLGITRVDQLKFLEKRKAFNSLSRDHRARDVGGDPRLDAVLSTPSLGITFLTGGQADSA